MSFSFTDPDVNQFSIEQRQAYDAVLAGRSVLISGPAGTGKSTILNALSSKFGRGLSVTASTGIAALNVGGATLHTFAGLGIAEEAPEFLVAKVRKNRGAVRRIRSCVILVIEEISMISAELFDKVSFVFSKIRNDRRPFGGVQVVLFGDFLQLPPVNKRKREDDPDVGFAFEARAWRQLDIKTILLKKVYRQKDQAFADALNDMRLGEVDSPRMQIIYERNSTVPPSDGVRPVIIDTTNAAVDYLNAAELNKIPEKPQSYHAIDEGESYWREKLDKDCLAPKCLTVKTGAQVMLLKNVDLGQGLANGSLGEVISTSPVSVTVKFTNGITWEVEREKFEISNGDSVLASRNQIPLRLAYAITAHKVQGMTLDRVFCRLHRAFECGQAYVAISRVRSIDGLFLSGFSKDSVLVHPKAAMFYANDGRTLSQDELIEEMLERQQTFMNFDV